MVCCERCAVLTVGVAISRREFDLEPVALDGAVRGEDELRRVVVRHQREVSAGAVTQPAPQTTVSVTQPAPQTTVSAGAVTQPAPQTTVSADVVTQPAPQTTVSTDTTCTTNHSLCRHNLHHKPQSL